MATLAMLGPLGPMELLVILMILLLLFGARRLPEMGAGLGKAIRSFKDALTTPDKQLESGEGDEKHETDPQREARR